jgi:hypothetical protein
MLKNATVSISYKVLGALLMSGKYEYRERTTTGSPLEEDRRLFFTKRPKLSDCKIVTTLSEAFVNFAISDDGRPSREDSFRAHTFWRKMTDQERLHWHIAKFCDDRGSTDFTYQIQES